ncbi:glutathione S-transferase family protein [Henriciella mobilis]|uniref:glutathione S-transferase family protein n=1 Tax=Henriciella mobilis TaxID=2305467 RepID=UPI000E6615CE|nr:glutathione S-transferase family protein [Henriciella mobilis]RIJ17969.1 glutathione S-transferase family protein [Henriciella mobilis]RIJ25223.1 glutathione S-transferase family protein [Henriciella mobilis]
MLIVYEHPLSPYAQKVKISLREKGIDFETRLPSGIGTGDTPDEFMNGNPRGEVPLLRDGDTAIFDSTVILEYIEDKWPIPPMLPAAPADRARVRIIEDVMDCHYEPINWGLGELNHFKRATGALKEKIESRAAQQVAGLHAWLERELGRRDWFNGETFGWGDLSVIPYVNGSAGFGLTPPEGSALAAWQARAMARPSVSTAAQEALDSISGMQDVSGAVEAGLFKREYRDHRLEWMIKSGGLDVVLKGLEKDNIRFTPDFS